MELSDEVPANVRDVLEDVGVFVPREGVSDEAMVVYMRMARGLCMHCASHLGDKATVIVSDPGVVMTFCSQVCLGDWHNVSYLQELYDDLIEQARFRNQVNNPDG